MNQQDMWGTYTIEQNEAHILRLAEAIQRKRLERVGQITDPRAAGGYVKAHCAGLEHEIFGCLFLDTRHAILAIVDLFRGTIDGSSVHPREVATEALKHNAAACIFFHNHPSGNPTPSGADKLITSHLKDALALFEIRVLDHLIAGGTEVTSMAAQGLM